MTTACTTFVEFGVTFIIPSIGRSTLEKTIDSLQRQRDGAWRAIIIFDGPGARNNFYSTASESAKSLLENTKNITIVDTECALGEKGKIHSKAGLVRNRALPLVETQWTAFVDDDDWLDLTYVEKLRILSLRYKEHDGVLFQVRFPNGLLIPCNQVIRAQVIMRNQTPISFAVRTAALRASGLQFENNECEDFEFLSAFSKRIAPRRVLIAPFPVYYVGPIISPSEVAVSTTLGGLLPLEASESLKVSEPLTESGPAIGSVPPSDGVLSRGVQEPESLT